MDTPGTKASPEAVSINCNTRITQEPPVFSEAWLEKVKESNRFLIEAYEQAQAPREVVSEPVTLAGELAALLNRYSAENGWDTSDFILADYLLTCLSAFEVVVRDRDKWHGFNPWGRSQDNA